MLGLGRLFEIISKIFSLVKLYSLLMLQSGLALLKSNSMNLKLLFDSIYFRRVPISVNAFSLRKTRFE